MNKMAKSYTPAEFEQKIYQLWLDNNAFAPQKPDAQPFVIVIPPPNVTAALHIGHGLDNTFQDVVIRYQRMLGKDALWVPGCDHAGIATQHVVEKELRHEGTSRQQLGRDRFVEKSWQVSKRHHDQIITQLRSLGASCDWDRERFTLDEGLSKAVREAFVTLYERDLLYRGQYLVNWCATCGTAISDDEVEHRQMEGTLYYISYPFADGSGSITVATTRPETIAGDCAVAVNPADERYQGLTGRMLINPLDGRRIPLIADAYVSIEFGSGALKITPAHDHNDWQVGERHGLDKINILTEKGLLNDNCPPFLRGKSVADGRKTAVDRLQETEALLRSEKHPHSVGSCYRCHQVVEPFLSRQWFVRMRPLADKALAAWRRGEVKFFPKQWENTYRHWLENIRDWCISRQLWWGHRIPVWTCGDCRGLTVSRQDATRCVHCGGGNLQQDEDVLDTWFSSWLWPFSVFGWPQETADLSRYFPTTTLVTGYDIIFFWVARMIMAGLEFCGRAPFANVYMHMLVRDGKGRKMSKSLGNGIDPLEIVKEYGADALKFTVLYMEKQGQDFYLDKETFKFGGRFANKLWNAGRFILSAVDDDFVPQKEPEKRPVDRWLRHVFSQALETVNSAMAEYRFNDAAHAVYHYFWNNFCDWYIEMAKECLYSNDVDEKNRILTLLLDFLEKTLRLLHPFLSFISEEIYQMLPGKSGMLINKSYPVAQSCREDEQAAAAVTAMKQAVAAIRGTRGEFAVPPDSKIAVHIELDDSFIHRSFFEQNRRLIERLANCSALTISDRPPQERQVRAPGNGFQAHIDIFSLLDRGRELARLDKEIEQLQKKLQTSEKKLTNAKFIQAAPAEVIERERKKSVEFSQKIAKWQRYKNELS